MYYANTELDERLQRRSDGQNSKIAYRSLNNSYYVTDPVRGSPGQVSLASVTEQSLQNQ